MRWPCSLHMDSMASFIFLDIVEIKPRIVCGCQFVSLAISAADGRFAPRRLSSSLLRKLAIVGFNQIDRPDGWRCSIPPTEATRGQPRTRILRSSNICEIRMQSEKDAILFASNAATSLSSVRYEERQPHRTTRDESVAAAIMFTALV
jgi:hypothetical protein